MNIQVGKWGVYMRKNKSPFPQPHRVSPGNQTVVNLRVDAVLA
jgi:hypothetical protein